MEQQPEYDRGIQEAGLVVVVVVVTVVHFLFGL